MPKTKTKKATKPQCKCKICPLTGILLVLVIGLTIFSGYLFCNRKTNEEKKRLQVFESVAASYIHDNYTRFIESNNTTNVATTGIGVTKDNDLYIDFTIVENDSNDIPLSKHRGRLHFQCGNKDGKVIGNEMDARGCAHAFHWDDPEPYTEEFRAKYTQYINATEEYTQKIIATQKEYCPNEDEECNLTDEQQEELRQKNLQLGKEYEEKAKYTYEDFYDELYK